MKRKVFILLSLFIILLSPSIQGQNLKVVYFIPIKEVIDLGLAPFVKRVLRQAEKNKVNAVIMEINTLGGRLDAAIQIRDALLDCEVPTIAFINKRAISAGALISLAAKHIVMAPGSSIGAAEPVTMGTGETKTAGEKVISYVRKEMKATAEKNKRPVELAEAMVDPDVVIKGIIKKGKLLTLTTEEALKFKLIDAKASNLEEVLKLYNLKGATIERIKLNWAEKVVRVISHPLISSLLLSLGMLGMIMEFRTVSWGIAGTLAIICLVLFFWGHYIVGLAGWEELLLFIVGIGLLIAEIFFVPGFGITGTSGIILILTSLVMALISRHPTFPDITGAISRVAYALLATFVISLALFKIIPHTTSWKRLVLNTEERKELGFTASNTLELYEGKTGYADTFLHPTGKAIIEGKRTDVVTEGGFIEKGTKIKVVKIEGNKVIVRENNA